MRVKKILFALLVFFLVLLTMVAALFLVRIVTPTEIDDVSPGILCPEIERYNPDVLYVIPDYNAHPLSFYPEWCKYILSSNKELGLHGLNHTYREFLYEDISQEELNLGIEEFEKCFGYKPEMFKPPQLAISGENKQLIIKNNLKFRGYFHQATHKVYHCNDDKTIPNKIIEIF